MNAAPFNNIVIAWYLSLETSVILTKLSLVYSYFQQNIGNSLDDLQTVATPKVLLWT